MNLKLLKTSIAQNNIPKFMVFLANESALCKQYIVSISNTLNKYYKYYDSADEVLYEASTNLKDDYLYIVLNDKKVLQNTNYINHLIDLDRHVILYFTELDTTSDFYKKYKDYCVDFKKLDKYTIVAYLIKLLNNNKIEVDQNKLETLVDYCECNLGCCLNELDKIITLEQSNSNLLFDYMLNNGFSDYRQTNVFKFINKILNKDLSAIEDVFKIDDSPIGLLTILYNQAYNKMSSAINGTAYRYADIMQMCSKLDSGIKDGSLNDSYILDYLLLKVM